MTKPVKNKNLQKGKTNNPNGRPVGSVNKRTKELLDIWEELDYCPGIEVIKLLKSGRLAADEESQVHLKLMKFKFPERKAVEHTFDPRKLGDKELLEETQRLLEEASKAIE